MATNPFAQFVQQPVNPFAQFLEQQPITPPGQIPGAGPYRAPPAQPSEVPMGRRVISFVRPSVEALGGVGGAIVGTSLGPLGTVGGSGLGYGLAKGGLDTLETALGYREGPSTVKEALVEGTKDVLLGSTMEAGGRVVAPIISKGLEKFGQQTAKVLDVKGRQATKVARAAAGDQIDAIRAALRNASPDELPAQATAGVPRKAWQSLNELGSSLDATDQILKQQSDDLLADLSRMARGGNETEIRNALKQSRDVLNQLVTPMRETELSAANQAAQTMTRLGPQATQKQASMVSALQQSGKLETEAAQRAAAAAQQLQRVVPGQIPAVSATQAARTQAAASRQFGEAADVFADVATQRRVERDFIQRQIGSLEDYGLRPLSIDNVTTAIESAMTAPGRRVSAQQQQVLGKVRDQLQAAAALNNGVVDARDLYTIRKEGVNEIIEDLMKGRDPKVSKKVAADVLDIVKPEIDKAIQQAGGTGWKAYLDTFAENAKELEKRQMAAEARRLFKDQPQEYIKLVRGDNTAAVESVFGTGNFDIFKEMAKEMPTLEKAASYIERQGAITKMAEGGREELVKIIRNNSWKRRLPNWFSPKITAANLVLKDVENRLSENTLRVIQQASTSNKSMLELLEGLPPKERTKLVRLINSTSTWVGSPAGRAAATVMAGEESANALAPESENVNALAR
jgi:hypothetical protein